LSAGRNHEVEVFHRNGAEQDIIAEDHWLSEAESL
jgi:hypothetical protein